MPHFYPVFLHALICTCTLLSCATNEQSTKQTAASAGLVDKVDMFMGNYGASYNVIGPQLPHGSVNPSPQTPGGEHDGYAPDQPIRGFGQLHVSGTGWGRYGQVFISPQIGFDPSEEGHDSAKSAEIATPYYYAVTLDRYKIKVELSPTHHAVAYRITFPKSDDQNMLLDIAHSIPQHITPIINGKFHGGEIHHDQASNTISGWGEYSGGFGSGRPYKVYFAAALSVAPEKVAITDNGDQALFAQIKLPKGSKVVNMNFGISFSGIDKAKQFLSDEIGTRTFDEIKEEARAIWEKQLGIATIAGGSADEQRMFYTALYHSFVMPRDRTGDNPHWQSDAPHIDDHYCIWDTWRTKYALMMILDERFVAKTINSFIDRFEYNGKVEPTFISALDGDLKQGGDNVDNVITDAFIKKIGGFDKAKAYEIIKHNAFSVRSSDYLRAGWQPENGHMMSCSYGLEFAYNDFCAAQVARLMGDNATATLLEERSKSWEKIFNPLLSSDGFRGFVGPRKENLDWIAIDPKKWYGSWVDYFYEGNSWVYSLFVPHQFERLIELSGGNEEMVRRVAHGLDNNLISMGNEPGFLSPFVFIHAGRPDLSAKYVSSIRRDHFGLKTGYPDNEDSGALGSWYVFTSVGLFPNAGQGFYYLLPPTFSDTILYMQNGKAISISVTNPAPENRYIASVTLNGKPLDRAWVRHHELASGGKLEFTLTDKQTSWATLTGNAMYQ